MATIEYIYDTLGALGSWTNTGNLIDGNVDTYAGVEWKDEGWSDAVTMTNNVGPGTNLGEITNVVAKMRLYTTEGTGLSLYAYSEGSPSPTFIMLALNQGTMPTYKTITTFWPVPAPSGTWKWDELDDYWIQILGFSSRGGFNSVFMSYFSLYITYTPAPLGLDLKVYGQNWTDIAKIHGVGEGDIDKVHGVN
jgi:hypothetical protein